MTCIYYSSLSTSPLPWQVGHSPIISSPWDSAFGCCTTGSLPEPLQIGQVVLMIRCTHHLFGLAVKAYVCQISSHAWNTIYSILCKFPFHTTAEIRIRGAIGLICFSWMLYIFAENCLKVSPQFVTITITTRATESSINTTRHLGRRSWSRVRVRAIRSIKRWGRPLRLAITKVNWTSRQGSLAPII